MSQSIDKLCDKLDLLIDNINRQKSINNSYIPNMDGYNDTISHFDSVIRKFADNLDDYNDVFENTIIKQQRESAERITEQTNRFLQAFERYHKANEQRYQQFNDAIQQATKVLKDATSDEAAREKARTEIKNAQASIKQLDDAFLNDDNGKRRKQLQQIQKERQELAEDKRFQEKFRNSKFGQSRTKLKEGLGDMRASGRYFQRLGSNISQTKGPGNKAIGGMINKAGKGLSSLSKVTTNLATKFSGLIAVIQILGDVVNDIAENHAKFIEIENKMRDAATQYNISFAKTTAEGFVDQLQTATANQLLNIEYTGGKTVAEQAIANAKNQNAVTTQIDSVTNGYNEASWASLSRTRDIQAQELKNKYQYELNENGDYDGKGFIGRRNERQQQLNTLTLGNNQLLKSISQEQAAFDYKTERISAERELSDYIKEQNGTLSNLTGIPLGTATAALQATAFDFDQTGNRVAGVNATEDGIQKSNNGFRKAESIGSGAAMGALTNGAFGAVFGNWANAAQTIYRAEEDKDLNIQKNDLAASQASAEINKNLSESIKSSSNQIEDAGDQFKQTVIEAAIDASNEMQKSYDQFAKAIVDWTLNFEKIAFDSAASKGLTTSAQNSVYSRFMNQTTQLLAHNWGLKAEEIIQMQNSYGEQTGRSLIGNETDMNKTAALGKYLGNNGIAVQLANSTEIFNMGMSDTMDLMYDMSKKVTKMGLDSRKYLKDMVNNLKMAQKYNFKNGVQGMMNMAKWAQNVRFNLDSLPSLVEDILNGGLEGIIEKGAKLQVLGGNFAMGADPLAMMYEAMEDPESLAKRINAMTEGMGTFNSDTGQVKFNGPEQQFLRLLAQYTDQNYEDVRAQASYKLKNEKMGYVINSDLNQDQRASLVNKAYWQDGEWFVNGIDGTPMKVADVTTENIDTLQADTHEGRMEQMLQEIVGWQDKAVGLSEEEKAWFAQKIQDDQTYYENQKAMYDAQQKWFADNGESNLKTIEDSITTNTNNFINSLHKNPESPMKTMIQKLSAINTSIGTATGAIGKIETLIKKMFGDNLGASENPEQTRMLNSVINGFKLGGRQVDRDKLIQLANTEYGDDKFEEIFGDIIGKGSSTQDSWFRKLSDMQKDAIRNNPELFYYTIKEHLNNEIKTLDINGAANHASDNTPKTHLYPRDGYISNENNNSALVYADNVTPIQDGVIAHTDPNDKALFAKTGGPFDTLFNGIFAKINEIAEVLPKAMEYVMPVANAFNNAANNSNSSSSTTIKLDTIKVELNGKLELSGTNGENIDIINELKNNPMMLRALSQMIGETINKNINGGKSEYTNGIPNPRFNNIGF